jgi:DNA-binding CsgD family transcriptional regulator
MSDLVEEAPLASSAAETALHLLRFGIAGVDDALRVGFRNRAFTTIVDAGDGLVLQDGALRAQRARDHSRLLAVVEAVAAGTEAASLTIDRPSGRAPYTVQAWPVPTREPQVLLFVTDPCRRPKLSGPQLVGLYDFSRAEAEVAARIGSGETPEQAASALGISVKTCRHHLESIFRKTGVGRQAALVGLLAWTLGQTTQSAGLTDIAAGPASDWSSR